MLLIDIDDVLVDFIGAACLAHGISRSDMEAVRSPNTWDIDKALGCNTRDEFWAPIISKGPDFWDTLEDHRWADHLLSLAEELYPFDWWLCTAPSDCVTSYTGKVKWIKRKFGSKFDRFFITKHKDRLAFTQRILIDDRPDNVHNFRTMGGEAIMFPSLGNPLSHLADDPMKHVEKEMRRLQYVHFGKCLNKG